MRAQTRFTITGDHIARITVEGGRVTVEEAYRTAAGWSKFSPVNLGAVADYVPAAMRSILQSLGRWPRRMSEAGNAELPVKPSSSTARFALSSASMGAK